MKMVKSAQKSGANALAKESLFAHVLKYRALYTMILLPFIYFVVFKYLPMFGNILAFRRYRPGMGPWGTEWVGLQYFERFIKDEAFWRAFRNTLITSLWNIAVNFPLPIFFAVILNEARVKWFKKVVQTISYMPRFISTVVVIAILGEILSPSSGILNRFLANVFGIKPIYFLNLPEWFRPVYVLTDSWQFTGWTAIIYLAAITNINADLFEAAEIDGASRIQKIFHVTIPAILPTVMVMLILQVGRMLSLGFEKVLLLYTPANSHVSDILDTLVYRIGLAGVPNYSYATAIGLFSSVIALVLVSSANFISRKLTGESIY
jgi:putative aldouronate transport system permease protein